MPYISPEDRSYSTENKPLNSHIPDIDNLTTTQKLEALHSLIATRRAKITYYNSLCAEHLRSISINITPYLDRQLEHEAAGRGIRRGSLWQMHLMMQLRIRVYYLREWVKIWEEENEVDQKEVEALKGVREGGREMVS